ncbi:MAG: efflux RND transporter periplasmic adaptor subunit [Magnetococcus sp. YQC-3]
MIISFRRLLLVLLVLGLGVLTLWWQDPAGFDRYWRALRGTTAAAAPAKGPVPVRVVTLSPRDFPVLLESLGFMEATATVTVKSRVDGQLLKVWFAEGAMVRRGDRLFTLDDRTFVAQVRQAQANLAKNQAQLEKARLDLKRYTELAREDVASKGQLEGYQAAVAALVASVAADQAQVDQARLQLEFATIDSPLDGLAGALLVHPGNTIKNNEAGLVVIHQVQPLDVKFFVAEKYLLPLRQRLAQGDAKVAIRLPEGEEVVEEAVLSFLNHMVDSTAGTLQVKARADNRAGRLLPGQYVRVSVVLQHLEKALSVPSEAVQTGQQGSFVFVIDGEETAGKRAVQVLASHAGEVAITGEVKPGDRVVVDGQVRLTVGAKALIRGADAPADGRGP